MKTNFDKTGVTHANGKPDGQLTQSWEMINVSSYNRGLCIFHHSEPLTLAKFNMGFIRKNSVREPGEFVQKRHDLLTNMIHT